MASRAQPAPTGVSGRKRVKTCSVEPLAAQILGRAREADAVVEGQAPGEAFGRPPRLRLQAVAALSLSSWRRAPAIIDARSDVSMIMSKPRFTAPAANSAL